VPGALFTGLDVTWDTLWMLDSESRATSALTGGGSLIPLNENGAAREEEHEERPVDRSPEDLALLLFTSASTGNARAVDVDGARGEGMLALCRRLPGSSEQLP
jgi:acyl-CoA synthetase (AMP-forming)/AMP-acid ligase II